MDPDSDDEYYSQSDKRSPHPASIHPEQIFGEEADADMIKLVTGDEIIEELQGIISVSNKIIKKHSPEEKENLNDFVKMRHIEGRLTEVVKENETLIDELQDKKFEVYKLRNKIETRKEMFEEVGGVIEDRVSEYLKRMGMSKKNIVAMQNMVKNTIDEFKWRISSDNESEGERYHPTLKKSESYQPLTSRNPVQKEWESDESDEALKSNQIAYKSSMGSQFVDNRGKTFGKSSKGTPNATMKSITNKTNNQNLGKEGYYHKSSASVKHLSSQKKPKKGKYLNYIESNKKNKEMMEHINIVPLNGYVPDIIQNLVGQTHN